MKSILAAAPSLTSIESTIVSAWRDVLKIETFGVDDRPFEAGATSASLLQVHYRIEQQLNLSISPVALFEHPTAAELARHLHQMVAPRAGATMQDETGATNRLKARQSKRRAHGAGSRKEEAE